MRRAAAAEASEAAGVATAKGTSVAKTAETTTVAAKITDKRGGSSPSAKVAAAGSFLPPYPAYRESGVEWLGEIPAHWEVKRLKHFSLSPMQYGANESAEENDPSFPRFVRITDIDNAGDLREDTFRSLTPDIARPFMLHEGDILLARSGATAGKSFLYKAAWGACCFAGYLIRFRPNQNQLNPQFLKYFLSSPAYWSWISSVFIQSTIPNVSAEKYSELVVPILPLPEQ